MLCWNFHIAKRSSSKAADHRSAAERRQTTYPTAGYDSMSRLFFLKKKKKKKRKLCQRIFIILCRNKYRDTTLWNIWLLKYEEYSKQQSDETYLSQGKRPSRPSASASTMLAAALCIFALFLWGFRQQLAAVASCFWRLVNGWVGFQRWNLSHPLATRG